jgi:ABC-type amino acid transport substrate-binding protein
LSSILTISLITAVTTVNLFNINNIQEISKFSDLSGRSVGTANATTSHDYLREFGYGINIKVYPNIGDTLKALDSGELEAVVYDQPILLNHILHEIRQNGKTQYVLVGDLFELQDYGIAVKNDTLKEYLNTGILQANRNPRYFSIYDSWFTPMEI